MFTETKPLGGNFEHGRGWFYQS